MIKLILLVACWAFKGQCSEIKKFLDELPKYTFEELKQVTKCRWWDEYICTNISELSSDPQNLSNLEYRFIQKYLPDDWCCWASSNCQDCVVGRDQASYG